MVSVPVVCWALEVGVALTPSHLFGLALILFAAWRIVAMRRLPVIDWPMAALAAFVLVAGVTVLRVQLEPPLVSFNESSHAKSIKQYVGLVYAAALFVSLRFVLRTYALGALALTTYFWTVSAAAVLAIAQYAVALADPESVLAVFPVHNSTLGGERTLAFSAANYGFPRIALTVVEPSWLATYLLTGLAFWLYAAGAPIGRLFPPRLFSAAGVILGIALVVSGSRQAYVLFAVLAVAAVLLRPGRLQRLTLVGVSVGLGIVLVGPTQVRRLTATLVPKSDAPVVRSAEQAKAPAAAVPLRTSARDTKTSAPDAALAPTAPSFTTATILPDMLEVPLLLRARNGDDSVKQRAASVFVGLEVLERHPWLGIGYGVSDFYMDRLWPPELGTITRPYQVPPTMMSGVIAVVTETGIIGGICIVLLLVGVFRSLLHGAKHGPESRALGWGVGAATGAYLVGTLTHSLVVYQMLLVWLLLALGSSLGTVSDEALQPRRVPSAA